jgi:hypothetical protein
MAGDDNNRFHRVVGVYSFYFRSALWRMKTWLSRVEIITITRSLRDNEAQGPRPTLNTLPSGTILFTSRMGLCSALDSTPNPNLNYKTQMLYNIHRYNFMVSAQHNKVMDNAHSNAAAQASPCPQNIIDLFLFVLCCPGLRIQIPEARRGPL